jgi:dolichol-phosphate mannosyltransferase
MMSDDVAGGAAAGPFGLGRVLVVIPTYNERDNLESIARRVRATTPDADVLVVDDASPDGTGELADRLAAADARVKVLHRVGKDGLGAAYIAGFRWALERGYDVVVEMDADGSHQPEQLGRLLAALRAADLVIGARWVRGGQVVNWPRSREVLSRGSNIYARIVLGIPLRDATAGFRAFRATTLEKIGLEDVNSRGYCFQVDLALRALRLGLRVVEVPITFVERTRGASKMDRTVVAEAMWRVTVWGIGRRMSRLRR